MASSSAGLGWPMSALVFWIITNQPRGEHQSQLFRAELDVSDAGPAVHHAGPPHPVTLAAALSSLARDLLPHSRCPVKRAGGDDLAKLRVSPGHFPHRAGVSLPGGRAGPVPRLVLVPHLHLLVRGAGRHPLSVEVVGHVMDEVLVLGINALGNVHCNL